MKRALSVTAITASVCLALMPAVARADASVEGYPYFAKLLGGRSSDVHKTLIIHDISVTGAGDVILVGQTKTGYLNVTNGIRFDRSVASGTDVGFALCMAPSGEWRWGVTFGDQGVSPTCVSYAYGVAQDGVHAYVVGEFENILCYSLLRPALQPGDTADSTEERVSVTDTYNGGGELWVPDNKRQGFVVKINIDTGQLVAALRVNPVKGSSTTMTSRFRDVAVYQSSLYVCGDLQDSNQDSIRICGVQSGYNVQDGYFAAKINTALTSCSWVVYGDDKGCSAGGDGSRKESDAAAYGIAVDDGGNAYVCGSIGGAGVGDLPACVYGTAFSGGEKEIWTGEDNDGSDLWDGTQSWFVLKVNGSGVPQFINWDVDNWDNDNTENNGPFSTAYSVVLAGGNVYVGGVYNGYLEDPAIGSHAHISSRRANTADKNQDGFLIRMNTNLSAEAIIEIGTTAQLSGGTGSSDGVLSLCADTANNRLYAFGLFGGPKSWFKVAGSSNTGKELTTLGSRDSFMAAVNIAPNPQGGLQFEWDWVRATAQLDSYLPPEDAQIQASAIDFGRGRVYCAGLFDPISDQPMKIGTEAKLTRLNVPDYSQSNDYVSFLTAVDSAGNYFEQATLEVRSTRATDLVSPGVGTFRYFKNSDISVTAPAAIYAGTGVDDYVAENEEDRPTDMGAYTTRYQCSGYTLGVGDKAESGHRYDGQLTEDTTIEFKWETQQKLQIVSEIAAPANHGLLAEEIATLGDPDPKTGVHWIKDGTAIGPQVTGVGGVTVESTSGLQSRYALTAYVGTGDAPSSGTSFKPSEQRLQFGPAGKNYFLLNNASTLTYRWTKQIEVRVRAEQASADEMPLVRVADTSGQSDKAGVGGFWFNHGTALQVGSVLSSDTSGSQLLGWQYATTDYFPLTRFVPTGDEGLGDRLSRDGDENFMYRAIASLEIPMAVTWSYDDIVYYLNASLGQPLDKAFMNATAVNDVDGAVTNLGNMIDFSTAPTVRAADDESGAQIADTTKMHIYDSVGKRSWLLQPGVATLEWRRAPGSGATDSVFTKIHTGFPGGAAGDTSNVVYYKGAASVLTEAEPNQHGAVIIDKPSAMQSSALTGFKATFDLRMTGAPNNSGWSAARGMSFSYGDVADDWTGSVYGTGSGLKVRLHLWESTISVVYGTNTVASINVADLKWGDKGALYSDANDWMAMSVEVTSDGKVTVTLDDQTICSGLPISGWAPQAAWRFAFGAHTDGGSYMKQEIREALITTAGTTHATGGALFVDGTEREITPEESNVQNKIVIDKPDAFQSRTLDAFEATFEFLMADSDSGHADGTSFTYGDILDSWTGSENGPGNGLTVRLDAYNPKGVSLICNGTTVVHKEMTDIYTRASDWATVRVSYSGKRATVYFDGVKICEREAVSNLAPKADWRFAFAGRCGGSCMRQAVRNVTIRTGDGDTIPSYFGNPAEPGDTYPVPSPDPRRKHVASTPPVDLDPSADDSIALYPGCFFFRADPGTSGSTVGALADGGTFTSGMAGWSVLVFSQSTIDGLPASGDLARERLFVRLVCTKKLVSGADTPDWWDSDEERLLKFADSVEVGTKLSSTYDTAGLGTGYLFYDAPGANYNAAIYDRANVSGPIIPVNRKRFSYPTTNTLSTTHDLIVVWYGDDPDYADEDVSIHWPQQPAVYRLFHWPDQAPTPGNPTTKRRIVIASRLGSAGKDEAGNEQFSFDPEHYANVTIYNQPQWDGVGYNPNEEHALIAPSFADLDSASPPPAAYALRDDLNNTNYTSPNYTSDPYVLVQYDDLDAGEVRMAVYAVEREDAATTDDRLPEGNQTYTFSYPMEAGQIVVAPYPLNLVIGAAPVINTEDPEDGNGDPNPDYPNGTICEDGDPDQRTWHVDHKGTGWAVSGGGLLVARFYYRCRSDFYPFLDPDDVNDPRLDVGDPICWLPEEGPTGHVPILVEYPTEWPDDVPILKAGETLTYSGGEYRADHPDASGLPGVIGWSAGRIVYDDLNPNMRPVSGYTDTRRMWALRLVSPLEERRIDLEAVPERLQPASGNVDVDGSEYYFNELTASLQRRVFFDSITKELCMRGYVNDRTLGDSDLTASPAAVYVLEPNILTSSERNELRALGDGDDEWGKAVDKLYALTLNPNELYADAFYNNDFLVGIQPYESPSGAVNDRKAVPFAGLGPGLAVVPNQVFLDRYEDNNMPDEAYVTLAENDDESLGDAPVSIHIIKVAKRHRYRGSVKVILPRNAFDEKVVLRHTGDFGTNTGDLVYQWFIREEDGTDQPLPDTASPDPWQLFANGRGKYQVALAGTGPVILRDNLVFVRYEHKNNYNHSTEGPATTTDWKGTKWDEYFDDREYTVNGTDYEATGEWAGAGNSPTVDGEFLPQLVMGWVKRVLDRINPYEARISDFTGDSPATYSSMIQQAGPRYEGQVALNADKDVIENHGLIELYQTVMNRAMDLSINLSQPANTPGVTAAILLAATRIANFYVLLGNEAWCDAMDPTIGIGSSDVAYGSLASSLFSFQNQLPSLLDEELALLRGVDTSYARPVYNRLFWNFTKEQGEAAYAANYGLADVTHDGFVDEYDAMKLFPQGHGDAWGHYLSALKIHYDLLNHKYFNWLARSELYNLMDIVIGVDYFDERHFAETAAAKARVGAQVCRLTYQSRYVDDPAGQWQGYTDTNTDRAWGVTGWARRAGQGALFDWLTANTICPAGADPSKEGIKAIDRTSVTDIAEISKGLDAVQDVYDDANNGLNPLGVHPDAVPFDIDPTFLQVGSGVQGQTHFDQICKRAEAALDNARLAFDHANEQSQRLRQIAESTQDLADQAQEQDLAFKNRLIEIFGTPYPEHIGAGKPYPAGYDGPDVLLYMYVDKNDLGLIDVGEQASDVQEFKLGEYVFGRLSEDPTDTSKKENKIPENDSKGLEQRLIKQRLEDFWDMIYNGESYTNDGDWDIDPIEQFSEIEDLTVPISARDYSFQAPEEWGHRRSVGKLQQLISQMVVAEAQIEYSKTEYYFEQVELNAMWTGIQMQADLAGRTLDAEEAKMDDLIARAEKQRDIACALTWIEQLITVEDKWIDAFDDGFPDHIMFGMASDVSLKWISSAWKIGISSALLLAPLVTRAGLENGASYEEFYAARDEMQFDFELSKYEQEDAIREKLLEFNTALGGERLQYISALQDAERHQQLANEYTTTLQEGFRIVEERANWNRKLARHVQQNRYQDMVLRLYRNEALSKYHDTFDLAARYVYLAAKAYDYETNLDENDPASASGLLTEIVRQRTLGAFQEGQPIAGPDGLADCVARLKADYAVLKGQMGFNNPQTETGRFSLRAECFRIHEPGWVDPESGEEADDVWRQQLESCRVEDLWNVWEFRHFCRPPTPYDPDVPEPGLVIRFPTEILFRYNFFGHELGPADHAYDPSHFATKIRSVGLWFTGYDTSALAETPRVYLVPAGADVMAVPTDNALRTRQWNIVNQRIPVPYQLTDSDLRDPSYIAANDSLNGGFTDIVRLSALRAYHDNGIFDESEMTFDSRLVGRSVWNTEWILIIPGGTLLHDSEEGINRLIYGRLVAGERDGNGITDIKLYFQTYAHSGG